MNEHMMQLVNKTFENGILQKAGDKVWGVVTDKGVKVLRVISNGSKMTVVQHPNSKKLVITFVVDTAKLLKQ